VTLSILGCAASSPNRVATTSPEVQTLRGAATSPAQALLREDSDDPVPETSSSPDISGEQEPLEDVISRLESNTDLESPWPSANAEQVTLTNKGRQLLRRARTTVESDYQNFYSLDNLGRLSLGLGLAAIVANTQMDREFQEQFQKRLRTSGTDSFARIVKPLGDGSNTIPLYAGAFVLGELTDDIPYVGDWGERSLRTLAVGVPPLLFLQKLTGGERPVVGTDSRWTPWRNNHGVSGHAFMGAIPFLTAAKMSDDPWLKGAFYIGSTMTAWSRVNDDAHYTSQAALGWWLAYLSATAVDLTNTQWENVSVMPMPVGDGMGLGIEIRR
jgi:hypothetical protein